MNILVLIIGVTNMTVYELLEKFAVNGRQRDFHYLYSMVSKEIYDQIDDKVLYQLLVNVMSMTIKYRDKNASFEPTFGWQNGVSSFSLKDLSDESIHRLESLDLMRLPLLVRAQICDVLWSIRGNYKYALTAADAYYELFVETYDPEKWVECVNMVNRAVILVAKLNNKTKLNDYLTGIYNYVVCLNGTDKLFFSTQMICMLMNQKYECDYNKLLSISDNLIAGNKENDRRLEEAYRVKVNLYKKLGKMQDSNETMIAYAKELISLADRAPSRTINDIFLAEKYYQKAISILQNYGQNTDDVIKKLLSVQKKIVTGLPVHSIKMDISDVVKMLDERYSIGYMECLVLLAIDVPWMEVEKTKQEVIKSAAEHPFQNWFYHANINKDGNTVSLIHPIDPSDPEKDQNALWENMYDKARKNEEIYAELALEQILDIIRNKDEFCEDSLDFIVKDNLLIPEGREEIFKKGLYLGISGKYYEALHILAPQVENLFRELAKACGDVVMSYKEGLQQAITLKLIFDRENLKLCYDEDIIFTFQGLMEKKEGSNIRNLIGHGLLGSDEVGYAEVFFICAVYKLLFYNTQNALDAFGNLTV